VLLVDGARRRQLVVLSWTEHLGLAPSTTSLVLVVAGAVNFLLTRLGRNYGPRRPRVSARRW